MRILHVIGSSDPARGGPIEAIRQAHSALESVGHEVELLCIDSRNSPWIGDFPFKVTALGPGWFKYRYSRRYLTWLRRNARNYDCVVVNGIWLFVCLGLWMALRNANIPYFIYAHGHLDPAFRYLFPAKHLLKTIYWRLFQYRVMHDAQAVLFTCESERDLARKAFRPSDYRGEVVPYCVGSPPAGPDGQLRAFYQRFPEIKGKRLLLFLSRIHQKKGCDLLIKAFAKVAKRDDSFHLVMAGPDENGWAAKLDKRMIEHSLGDRITWTGMLSGDLKWGAFRAAEVFVLPSHQENFGIAIVEALACEVPVLITNKVNIWQEVLEDGAGFVSGDDQDGATELLERWLSLTPHEKWEMKRKAGRCFSTRFRSDKAAERLIQILRSNGVTG